jgi:hypothetical protein
MADAQSMPSPSPHARATDVNPHAGQYVVTGDPREQAAAVRAGERTLAAWPYYVRRYGERGRFFTRSDSGWIATLPGLPSETVLGQVRWLAALLAARGMPRLLMERHLVVLQEELASAVPERADDYVSLAQAAEALRSERTRCLPEALLDELELDFRNRVRATGLDDLRAGALIGAAVADERAHVAGAVESLLAWLADTERWPAEWLTAVAFILDASRTA